MGRRLCQSLALALVALACAPASANASERPAATDAPAWQRLLTELDAWNLEGAVALTATLPAEPRGGERCALAALALEQGRPEDGIALLRAAQAEGEAEAGALARCREIAPRLAASAALAEGGQTFRSAHFWLRARDKDEVVAGYALDVAERALAAIGPRLGWPAADAASQPIGIELHPHVASLAGATGLPAQAIETSGTVAVCKEHRLMLLSPLATASGYDWADTLSHELVHLLVGRASRNRAPVWLQEGLAKTYERGWRGEFGAQQTHGSERRLRAAARANELIPLSRMHPSVALLPSHQQTALAFSEVSSLVDGIRRRVGDAPLSAMLARLARAPKLEAAWRAPLWPLGQEESRWRRRLQRLPPLEPQDGDDQGPVVLAQGAKGASAPTDAPPEAPGARGRLLRLGELLGLEGRWAAASEAYRRAAAATPGGGDARLERAWARALAEAGEGARAVALLRQSLARDAGQSEAQFWLGTLLAREGRCQEAEPHLLAFIWHNPFVAEVHEAWARCAEARGQAAVAARERRFAALCGLGRDEVRAGAPPPPG